ncbi:glycosyltransferase [Lysinibacillus piscis]|uniref:Glycosyl transferase family 1 n=1 Tax=Lysinibacillus piscis TaxID=2518931 RepID=A0ABQ5NHT7_9BACI|nr:glycosyltransferase [Lysinibacillus sp. KH24]GLC87887.1 glycosyl transferase family 1 [Lysinibacillus sp. KH24]
MKIIKKFSKLLKNEPLIIKRKLIHKLPKKIKGIILKFPKSAQIKDEILLTLDGHERKIFIFPSPSCPWGYMFQRPQQLARALAKEGHLVFYLVDTSFPYEPDWNVRSIFKIEPNLYLYNDNVDGKYLMDALLNHQLYVWQYWPHQLKTITNWESIHEGIYKIYDCIDFIETFDAYDTILNDFEISIQNSDCLLATAKTIENSLKCFEKEILYIPNAVAIEDFQEYKSLDWPNLEDIKNQKKKIIGYYGAIAEWFDFETIEYLATVNSEWIIVLVGEVYPAVEDRVKKMECLDNVKLLERISYDRIPYLLSSFDVAILPFILNNITLNTSPVKVFEYLAGGKNVVSSPLPEVLDIEGIFIGRTKEEFEEQIRKALELKSDEHIKTLKEIAEQHTWQKRVKKILEYI